MSKNDSYQISYLMRVAVGVFLVACAASFMTLVPYLREQYGSGRRQREALKAIETELEAIAQLENELGDEAANAFARLAKSNPERNSHWVNLAIARLVAYENVLAKSKDPEQAASPDIARLPQLRSAAKEAVEKAIAESDSAEPLLLKQKLYEKLILEDQSLKSDLSAELLAEFRAKLQKFPGDARLASAFDTQIESQVLSQPDLIEQSIDLLYSSWEANPRNLFLGEKVARRLAELDDSRLVELIKKLVSIAGSFEWEIDFVSGEELTAELKTAIASNDVDEIDFVGNGWLNELKRTTAYTSDRRNTDLDRLALIDFSNVIAEREKRIKSRRRRNSDEQISFQPWPGGKSLAANSGTIAAADCIDWDNDLRPELISIVDGKLKIERLVIDQSGEATSDLLVDIATMPDATGIVCVGLSLVQGSSEITVDPAVLTSTGLSAESVGGANSLQNRTRIIRDVIVYGPSGIEVFNFADSQSAESSSAISEPDKVGGATEIGKKLVSESNLVFKRILKDSELSEMNNVADIQPLDWDSDGDLDLAILSGNELTMWLNVGNKQLRRFDEAISSILDQRTASAAENVLAFRGIDFDRDLDIDLIATLADGKTVGVFENLQHSQFRFREFDSNWSELSGATSLRGLEIDGNASWDWVGSQPDRVSCVFTSTAVPGQTMSSGGVSVEVPVRQFLAADLNNSGQLEMVVASDRGVSVLDLQASRDGGQYSLYESELPVDQVLARDINLDGNIDLILRDAQKVVLLKNSGTENAFVAIRIHGVDDNGGGGRVNSYTLGTTVELQTSQGYQARFVDSDQIHFGLGQDGQALNARFIFPNGVTQNAIDPPEFALIEEEQFPKGSCPFVYGWDGHQFSFITDLLWNAPLGLQYAKGRVVPDRRWEYLMLPEALMKPKDGGYEIRVTEELWEAAYFDHIALLSADVPEDLLVYSNEKVGPAEIASPGVWRFDHLLPETNWYDQHGKDWSGTLAETDSEYCVPFDRHICQGVVPPYRLKTTVGDLHSGASLQMVLNGWIYPTDTSLNIGLDQHVNRAAPDPPSLWIEKDGQFINVSPFIGFPGGKPKDIVVDLTQWVTDEWLVDGNLTLEIRGSSEIYWDSIRFSRAGDFGALSEMSSEFVELNLAFGRLHQRGFSAIKIGSREQPHFFQYDRLVPEREWPMMDGLFTREGDVTKLLTHDDDRMVVMGSGDEIELRFEMPEGYKLSTAPGMKRVFLLHSVGWDKDADLNTIAGQSADPLPFAKMQNYPAPATQRSQQDAVDVKNATTRTRRQTYRSRTSIFSN